MRELLSAYEFDGDNTPFIQGSALGALNGVEKWEEKSYGIDGCLLTIGFHFLPRDVDKPFLMPVEDAFSNWSGTVATGRIEAGVIT